MQMNLDLRELLRELVAINSVNPFFTITAGRKELGLGNETEINEYIEALLQKCGFETERQIVQPKLSVGSADGVVEVPERWNLLAQKGPSSSKKNLLLFGHSDTVDVKPGWQTDPFQLVEKEIQGESRLFGLGANDLKGGLACILAAAISAEPRDFALKIAILVDEEYWSFGADKLVHSTFLENVGLALTPEIGETDLSPEKLCLGLGRLGRAEFEFKVQGRACHGADAFTDQNSINAVHQSARLQVLVQDYCSAQRREFVIDGIKYTNACFINFHQGGQGMLSVPDSARFIVDQALLPGDSEIEELEKLQKLIADAYSSGAIDHRARISVQSRQRPTPPCQPYYFSAEDSRVVFVQQVAGSAGIGLLPSLGRSVADENRIASAGICVLTLGPRGAGSHSSAEWVDASSLEKVYRLYKRIIEEWSVFAQV